MDKAVGRSSNVFGCMRRSTSRLCLRSACRKQTRRALEHMLTAQTNKTEMRGKSNVTKERSSDMFDPTSPTARASAL